MIIVIMMHNETSCQSKSAHLIDMIHLYILQTQLVQVPLQRQAAVATTAATQKVGMY
jgi:hypothetical protein